MSKETGTTGAVLGAFMIGAVAGAAVAVLFAPASGEETRRKIGEKARMGREKAEGLAREGREFLQRQCDTIGAAVDRGREVFEQARKESV
jgi:gas vesicle protein